MLTAATYRLARHGGRGGRELAVRLDLLASLGPRSLLQRRRDDRELARRWPGCAVNGRIWSEAAAAVGARLRDHGDGAIEIERGGRSVRVRLHVTPIDPADRLQLALDKAAVHRLLSDAGLSVPRQLDFDLADLDPPARLLGDGREFVVKPAAGTSSGQGTTPGVRDRHDLTRAAVRASRSGGRQALERQATGEEYRLLLLDGEPLGVVRRLPPAVVGDARATVAELVARENRHRLDAGGEAGLRTIALDLDAALTLRRSGLRASSVPAAGQLVVVKTARSQGGAREAETVPLDAISGELVEEARRAAATVGLRLAGIDLITPDPTRSLAAAGGAIVEVNGTPGLHYHYLVREPARADRVAVPLLERLLSGAGAG